MLDTPGAGRTEAARGPRGRGAPIGALPVTVLIAAALTGCAADPEPEERRGPTGSPSASASRAVPLTIAAYQSEITALQQAVRPVTDRAMAAAAPEDLAAARADLIRVLGERQTRLTALEPPREISSPHRDLVAWLSTLILNLERPEAPEPKPNECGVLPDARTLLHDAKSRLRDRVADASLTSATRRLSTYGITVEPLVPEAPAAPELAKRRAGNGEIVTRTGTRGGGRLEIDNGTAKDVAVAVVTSDPARPQVLVYVRAKSEATVSGLSGTYRVYIKSGEDWDAERRGFTRGCTFEKFDDVFPSTSDWQIGLQPRIGGNATTSDVPAF